jgi:hypothetical protein
MTDDLKVALSATVTAPVFGTTIGWNRDKSTTNESGMTWTRSSDLTSIEATGGVTLFSVT